MTAFSFEWSGPTSLGAELAAPALKVSIPEIKHDMIFAVRLWRADGTAMTICSRMYDVGPREEVGVLCFEIATHPVADAFVIDLPEWFLHVERVMALVAPETNGILAESGIVLEMQDGQKLTIVAGHFPHAVAVEGLPRLQIPFRPEWPIEAYDRRLFAGG